MITFNSFHSVGKGLGNLLFKYAFLRTTARRLGVKFHCRRWIGDQIFLLEDTDERVDRPEGIRMNYKAPRTNCGFNPSDLQIQDGTDIRGFFQSERCFDTPAVREWYVFKGAEFLRVEQKYGDIDFADAVGIHLRFGDKKTLPQYVIHRKSYYIKALGMVKHKKIILVFSDEPDLARKHLKGLKGNMTFIERNTDYEDLYLMSRCHDFICSSSTISWWGAWLNKFPDKTIIVPKEWFRPGFITQDHDLICDGWTALQTCIPVWDDYILAVWRERIRASWSLRR